MKRMIIFLLPAILLLTGCTHANGDIGDLFGNWKLTSVKTTEGEPANIAENQIFWGFQSAVLQMTMLTGHEMAMRQYAMWHIDDNILFVDFDDPDFHPFSGYGFTNHMQMQILLLTRNNMVLQYDISDSSSALIYTFQKW